MLFFLKAMPGIHSKPTKDVDSNYGSNTGDRNGYTKCNRCGKRESTSNLSGSGQVCLECARNGKPNAGIYWDTERQCFGMRGQGSIARGIRKGKQ